MSFRNMEAQMPSAYLVIFVSLICHVSASDEFHEEVLLRPLPSGHLHAHFQFTTRWHIPVHTPKGDFDTSHFVHYHRFPKAFGEIIAHHKVQELHLSQTMGLWKTRDWGYPLSAAPPGVELWAWFHPSLGGGAVDATWKSLSNALAGLSCSSLNYMDAKSTVSPLLSFRPTGAALPTNSKNSSFLRYGSLPREIVCTENLTPWKKLLPCDSKAGLSTLFNDAKKLYDSAFHSLAIHLRPVCRDAECSQTSLELAQSVSVVLDPFVQGIASEWSIKRLFGKVLLSHCPLATTSRIMVEVTSNGTRLAKDGTKREMHLTPSPSSVHEILRGGARRRIAIYDVRQFLGPVSVLNVACRMEGGNYRGSEILQSKIPDIHASRHVTGTGQHRGGVASVIHNNADRDTTIILMETVPWYLRTFYHTISVNLISRGSQTTSKLIPPLYLHYIPSKDNVRATLMELAVTVPARSSVRVTYDFERAFLKWTAYPPDANHGFYVGSGVITAVLLSAAQCPFSALSSPATISSQFGDNSKSFPVRIYTEPLLVTMPTPDFSMPYNVICLVSTAVAIAFGTIHNQATRRFVKMYVDDEKDEGALKKLLKKVKNIFRRKQTATPPSAVAETQETNERETNERKKIEQTTNEQLTIEQLTIEQLTNEQLTNEQLTNEQLTNEQLTNEQLTNEQLTNEQLTNEQLTNEQLTNEQFTNEPFTNEPFTNEPFTNEQTQEMANGSVHETEEEEMVKECDEETKEPDKKTENGCLAESER